MSDQKTPSAVPSLNQMRARMTLAHRDALRNFSVGKPANVGRAAYNTLLRWGAIDNGGITEIGKALLERVSSADNEVKR